MEETESDVTGADEDPRLERIRSRIPPAWGQWVSCGPGWSDLLVTLDGRLATLDPAYQVQQVKEKFGGLRYHWSPSESVLPCCARWEEAHLQPDTAGSEWDRWAEALSAHQDDEAHRAHEARRAEVAESCARLVRAAEEEASRTCEETGRPGVLMVKGGWYRTLDPGSAPPEWEVVQGGPGLTWELKAAGDDPERLRALVSRLAAQQTHLLAVLHSVRSVRP